MSLTFKEQVDQDIDLKMAERNDSLVPEMTKQRQLPAAFTKLLEAGGGMWGDVYFSLPSWQATSTLAVCCDLKALITEFPLAPEELTW